MKLNAVACNVYHLSSQLRNTSTNSCYGCTVEVDWIQHDMNMAYHIHTKDG